MPLRNKIFLNLRPREQSDELSSLLRSKGATVLEFACLELFACDLAQEEIKNAEKADCLVFTSSNGLKFARNQELRLNDKFIACIGEQTKRYARSLGLRVDFVPSKADAGTLALELSAKLKEHGLESVALLRAKKGDPALREILEKANLKVSELALYDSRMPKHTEDTKRELANSVQKIDLIIFTSSEICKNFLSFLKEIKLDEKKIEQIKNTSAASIGIKTEQTLRAEGFKTLITSQKACIKSLVDEILTRYE